ncbi:Hypothetical_protein [Hexamita inflata]|uniref:Hypothetical_protein n=1 Tax=Hexamita inflata TaxID=28002 RepID=A0AA86P6C3_9EUKA|nr:Hypothetical protein HINF_LOCUS20697 [Hexamita inflata]
MTKCIKKVPVICLFFAIESLRPPKQTSLGLKNKLKSCDDTMDKAREPFGIAQHVCFIQILAGRDIRDQRKRRGSDALVAWDIYLTVVYSKQSFWQFTLRFVLFCSSKLTPTAEDVVSQFSVYKQYFNKFGQTAWKIVKRCLDSKWSETTSTRIQQYPQCHIWRDAFLVL